ncbi:hypothetical protein [Roseivirga misakiensis]|uniref:DUF4369 domain-containing protein n=1 Tax=Roseivirga misakiensis TaxID=1563681 RepID=A0A1E5T0L4_9BACT|nr:hypothetical protein [Roseivirga misakiensis]OEK04896.1 hypothetical protein BFP71_15775 [Roseivirga misakiensis]
MKFTTSTFLLFLFAFSVSAQDTIITMKGDTLNGSFSLAKSNGNEFVNFTSNQGKKERFRLFDVKQIKTADGEILEPIRVDKRYTFGKVMAKGYLSLHSYRSENSNVTFNQQILTNYDGSSLAVPGAFGFKKAVSRFLEACPAVSEKVNDKTLGRDDLDQIITEYNNCIGALANKNKSNTSETTKNKAATSPTLASQKSDFETLLKYSDVIENKEDVSDMLNDLVQKLSTGQAIPNYLRKIMTEAVSKDAKLSALLKKILE